VYLSLSRKIHTLCFAHSLRKILHLYFSCFLLEKKRKTLFLFSSLSSLALKLLVYIFKLTEVPFYRPSFMLHGQQSPSSGFPATTFLHQALLLSTNGTIFLTCLVKDQLPAKNVLGFPFFSPSRSSLVNKCEPPSRSSLVNKCEPQ
jgi:hypothetical protein